MSRSPERRAHVGDGGVRAPNKSNSLPLIITLFSETSPELVPRHPPCRIREVSVLPLVSCRWSGAEQAPTSRCDTDSEEAGGWLIRGGAPADGTCSSHFFYTRNFIMGRHRVPRVRVSCRLDWNSSSPEERMGLLTQMTSSP